MKKDIYSYLSILAMVAVPIAPAFYFGFDVAQEVYNLVFGWVQVSFVAGIFAVLIGLGAVIGLELVGILSGHNIVKYFSLGMNKIAAVCGFILIAYVVLGIIGLENVLTKGVVMFLTAPLVYVLATMQQTAASIDTKREENEQVLLEFKLAEKAKDNEINRQKELEKNQTNLQIKLEKERAKSQSKTQTIGGQFSGQFPSDFRSLTKEQKDIIANLTSGEIAQMATISDRTARRWKEKVSANGYHK